MDKFNWDTEFNTSEHLMIHTFTDRVKVVTNLKNLTICYMKDGEVIDRIDCSEMTLTDYERYLGGIARCAETLKKFSYG